MKNYLFANFLESRETYEECRRYWATLVDSIARSLGQSHAEWKPWMPQFYGDGVTPVARDGNPIFDAHHSHSGRAFQICQQPPDCPPTDAYGVGAAWETNDDPGDLPPERLWIAVVLDEDSARTVEAILRLWMDPSTPLDHMTERINHARKR